MSQSADRAGQDPVRPDEIPLEKRPNIRRYGSWHRFHVAFRRSSAPLLNSIDRYPNAVLVAGCQRSGTTMLTRLIAQAAGFRRLELTKDDELDAALVLAGQVDLPPAARYVFQTTYLNDRYFEYASMRSDQRLIWVLRNPYSVIYSMLHNWKGASLDRLYEGCGITLANTARLKRWRLPWPLGPSQIEKACLSYSAKTTQTAHIRNLVPTERLLIVDYDELIANPGAWLPRVFDFIGEPFAAAYSAAVRSSSLRKADRLSARDKNAIARYAEPIYRSILRSSSPGSS